MGVTRDDVARKAGVSTAVVSYVLNDGPRPVSPETREKVLRAIDELGYRANFIARSLRAQRTHMLGVIVPDSSNQFYSEVAKGIGDMAYSRHHTLILGSTNGDFERQSLLVENYVSHKVDGLIFITMEVLKEDVDLLEQYSTPAVYVSPEGDLDPSVANRISSITIDSEGGGYAAGRHLVERGHVRLACITGGSPLGQSGLWSWNRVNGFVRAVEEGGGQVQIIQADEYPGEGQQATLKLMAGSDRPTAIFTSNDMLAVGVLRAAADLHLSVPHDLAVCGFDDIGLASYVTPRLTTVRIDKYALGWKAASRLFARLDQLHHPAPADPSSPETFMAELIVREST
ncbi:MAG: LacI family DNA-binding transcriptional regulator [Chloroflexota bacterium]